MTINIVFMPGLVFTNERKKRTLIGLNIITIIIILRTKNNLINDFIACRLVDGSNRPYDFSHEEDEFEVI